MKQNVNTQAFIEKFQKFIQKYECPAHHKTLNFLCVDQKCEERGIICSNCLTVTAKHKNHDALDLSDFYELCMKDSIIENNPSKYESDPQLSDYIQQISQNYQNLLKTLTQFHQSFSNIITKYIQSKSKAHQQRETNLTNIATPTSNNKHLQNITSLQQCSFNNLQEANTTLKTLINVIMFNHKEKDLSTCSKNQKIRKQIRKREVKDFVDDIKYQFSFIKKELKGLESNLKELLIVKTSTPVILNQEPKFLNPTFIQNSTIAYIGEERDGLPHGNGICFFKEADKIVYGNFHEGKVQGNAELYFLNGDYYIGEFRQNLKEGRGVYRWNAKQSNVYEGQFAQGRRHGRGTFWWGDGSRYQGQFIKGTQTGNGILFRQGKIKQYDGNWLSGMFNGFGIQYFQNGQRYQGNFKSDKFHGQGIFYKKDSQEIHGIWTNNQLTLVNDLKN